MSIRAQIAILLVGLTLVTATTIGGAGYVVLHGDLLQAGLNQGRLGVAEEVSRLRLLLHGVRKDTRVLATSNDLLDYLDTGPAAIDDAGDVSALRRVEQAFENLARIEPRYLQIRYLDLSGREQVRVNARQGLVTIVPGSELQDKSHEAYINNITELPKDQVYVSRLDLNREQGAIEEPHQPTMRFITPVFDRAGRRRGGIVINVDGWQFLTAGRTGESEVLLIDAEGFFLRHPNPELTFGIDLDPSHDVDRLAPALAVDLKREAAGAFLLDACSYGEGACATAYDRVPFDRRPDAYWTVAIERPVAAILTPLAAQSSSFLLATLVVTVLAGAGGYAGARLLTRPLTGLARAARRIQTGHLDVAVAVKGTGELAVVASTFNNMAATLKASIESDRASLLKERRARMQLEATAADLARANRELEQFVEVASHDLSGPIQRISQLAEWLEEDVAPALVSGPLENVEDVRHRVLRIERLLTDLLDYARAINSDESCQDVDTRLVIDQVVALVRPPPGVVIAVTGEMPVVPAPEGVLHRVFGHLIDNAIRHCDRDQCRIGVAAKDVGEAFEFEVRDDGPGIPPEAHERIFNIFQTLGPGDESGGSGVGLAIVRRLLEVHGGAIRVSSTPGQRGTAFHVIWPKRVRYRQAA